MRHDDGRMSINPRDLYDLLERLVNGRKTKGNGASLDTGKAIMTDSNHSCITTLSLRRRRKKMHAI